MPFRGRVQAPALTAPVVAPVGLTGATTASRYVGATAGGSPTSGTFSTGDWVVDTVSAAIWFCTAGGSPGTWTEQYDTPDPAMNGILGQTMSLEALMSAPSTGSTTAQRVYASRMRILKSAASGARNLQYGISTAGVTTGTGVNIIACFNSAGTLLGSNSADQTSNFAATGFYNISVGSFGVTAGDTIYVCCVNNYTGTLPKFYGSNIVTGGALNYNLATSQLRSSVQSSGATVMPGSITPGSLSATSQNGVIGYWLT